MKKILVISSYPAPYRVAVFRGLAKYYQMDIFFEFIQDQSRSAEWFVRSEEFKVLNTPENKAAFDLCLKHVKDYDLVLAYDYNNTNAGRLIRTCIRKKVPYIINCDGAFINPHWLKDMVKRYYISHACGCFASGQHAAEYFLHYGAEKDKIHLHQFTSMNEEDVQNAAQCQVSKAELRASLGLEDIPTAVTIGQFIHRKGFDVLLDAWKDVPQPAQLVLVGGGDLEEEYRRQIRDLNLKNVYLVGFVAKEKVFQYYHASDLFVLPTREDIWGLVINESMASGLPVIGTDRCVAAVELIENGVNGYVTAVGDVPALAEAMTKILTDPALSQQMSRANLEKIASYTLENIVENHRRVIDNL